MAINIMITDDHSMIREGLKNLLELDGDIKVIAEAENGEDCLDKLKTFRPDVLLLDINMPVLDGWQFLEEYRLLKERIKKEITIYIISSSDHTTDKDKAKFYQPEVKDYFLKPMTSDSLKQIFN